MFNQTNIKISPVETDHDLEVYASLSAKLRPDMAKTATEIREEDEAMPTGAYKKRWIAYENEEPVCGLVAVQMYWAADKNAFVFRINPTKIISPDLSKEILQFAESEISTKSATSINTWTPIIQPDWIKVLEQSGFKFDQANPESALKLTDLDTTPFQTHVEEVRQKFTIISLDQFLAQNPEDGWARYHEFDTEVSRDIPSPYVFEGEPLENFVAMTSVNRDSFPTIQLALDNETIAGTSMLFRNKVFAEYYWTGLTAVRKQYRRQGIAKALKVINFELARASGATMITCDNEENNPMLQLNYQLGFKELWIWNSYSKKL